MKMKHVLAMYDIRGKQAFIFRTNKLKEIAGASLVIRDLYKDYLIPVAKKVPVKKEDIPKYDPEKHMFESDKINHLSGSGGIFFYKNQDPGADFSEELCKKHLGDGIDSFFQGLRDIWNDDERELSSEEYKKMIIQFCP